MDLSNWDHASTKHANQESNGKGPLAKRLRIFHDLITEVTSALDFVTFYWLKASYSMETNAERQPKCGDEETCPK